MQLPLCGDEDSHVRRRAAGVAAPRRPGHERAGRPYPAADPEALARSVLPHFIRLANELGYDLGNLATNPEPVRVALCSVLAEMLEDVAVAEGATFVPVPNG